MTTTQPRKQRKSLYTAKLHVLQKMVHAHLSTDLQKKHNVRSVQIRKGDTVRVMRGQFKRKQGVVETVNLKRKRVTVAGVEQVKHDSSKVSYPLHTSNLMVISLDLGDKKRKAALTRKAESKQDNKKVTKSKE